MRLPPAAWLVVAAITWGGLAFLAAILFAANPPAAGFDLELVLRAGRAIAEGRSPYDPSILAGAAPGATNLFYSYPPPVGQAAVLVAWLPLPLALAALAGASAGGLAAVVAALARRLAPGRPVAGAVLPALALAPVAVPYAIALLFGNLDALFPLVYGCALLAALPAALPGVAGRVRAAGGVAIALAAIAKLYPAGLGLWFLVRAVRDRGALVVVGAAVVTGLAVVAVSLVLGGAQPWLDYATVARTVAGSEVVDARNVGPAAIVARLLGGDEGLARMLHLAVAALAVATIAWSAARVADPVLGLAIASAATLLLLPVTWYHYPAALIPFAVAAVLREPSRRATVLTAAAAVTASAALVAPPLLWVAVGLVLVAAARSRR